MNFEFAESCVFSHYVLATKRDPKTLRFVPEVVQDHAVLAINTQDGAVDFSLKSSTPEQDRTLAESEQIRFMTLLKPRFLERVDEQTVDYAFGVADGPIENGEPTTAAVFRLTFSTGNEPSEYKPYREAKVAIDEQWVDGGWVLSLQNGLQAPAGSTLCHIETIQPIQPEPEIETSAVVHVLDLNGNLLCLIEGEENNEIRLRYEPEQGFMLLCLVEYQPTSVPPGSGQTFELTFSVGDPRTDAKVMVIEDDTAADIFSIFSDFIRNLTQWFRNLFSA